MKILHLADTHIGTRQYGLEVRRADFSKAFQQAIEIAINEGVDAVVHAGDLFDDRYPTAEDLHETLRALFLLKEAGIPFLGVVGNHEQRRGVQWLDLFAHLGLAVHLSAERPHELGGVPFWGLDYAGRRAPVVRERLPRCADGVLVAHQMLDRVQPQGELTFEALLETGARVVLLGDYHEHEVWRESGRLITYSGSTERWSLDEKKPRGVSVIDLEAGVLERRRLETRRFVYVPPDEDPLRELEARRAQLKGAVVCVYLGDGWEGSVQAIEERARAYGALAVRVRDRRERAPLALDPLDPEGAEGEPGLAVQLEFGNLDALLSERLAQRQLSELAREIDAIIRDPRVADSNVDAEVTQLLEASLQHEEAS